MRALLEGALSYASYGWHVTPLHDVASGPCSCPKGAQCGQSAGKHPRLDDWTQQGSTDPARLAQWWHAWPAANIGLVTGLGSGLGVLDVDPHRP
jgi:hypothetical protein